MLPHSPPFSQLQACRTDLLAEACDEVQVTGDSLADSTLRAKRKGRRGGREDLLPQIPVEVLPKVHFALNAVSC